MVEIVLVVVVLAVLGGGVWYVLNKTNLPTDVVDAAHEAETAAATEVKTVETDVKTDVVTPVETVVDPVVKTVDEVVATVSAASEKVVAEVK